MLWVVRALILMQIPIWVCGVLSLIRKRELTAAEISLSACEKKKKGFYLYSDGGEIYGIASVPDGYDLTTLTQACTAHRAITVLVSAPKERAGDQKSYLPVEEIKIDGAVILSREEVLHFHRAEFWPLLLVPAGILVLWTVYVIASVIVGRNPEKYRKQLRLFFKPEYIIWPD